jgi:hypothetical protein
MQVKTYINGEPAAPERFDGLVLRDPVVESVLEAAFARLTAEE